MRIAIIGNSGSGKSTLARRLAGNSGTVILDLDSIAWEPEGLAVLRPPAAAAQDVTAFCRAHEDWIVEGCYTGLLRATLPFQPRLLFLNPGEAACLDNCRRRPWEPHKYSSPAAQDAQLAALLDWVSAYYRRDDDMSLAAHAALFAAYDGDKQELRNLPGDEGFA